MSILRNLASGLRTLFRKKQMEQEMDEELRGYLDADVKEKMRAGMSYEQALRAARVEMGSMDAVKERFARPGGNRRWKRSGRTCVTACGCCAGTPASPRWR